ncbi:conserved protein of unknown function [Petrocella atlantisensis]|uniref:Nucleotidyl transferase AbiEii/AbiGii toxin family protein n=1 Tax=Petrocella atlantisensis TaxID=2173034 RepID=A0A3P7PVB3_9FIRM|nr:nucleotidyl transferase AbiEii/AbiGii toxin family protein [Petrocella atlantisensis]VDN47131.1 conserved protein of unknown function [Petrocella atlantisensis]
MKNEKSILQKLKNRARVKRLPYQLVLQLFCQEEFLRRLSVSEFKENLILKGGLFLFSYNGFEGRPTMDIDFLAKNISDSQVEMKDVIEKIMKQDGDNQYIDFMINAVENITEQKAYHGVRIKMVGIIGNTRTPFDIDIGIGDVIVPSINMIEIPTQLDGYRRPVLRSYSLESTIAEKLEAMFSRMETTSRMKDYYDIYYLAIHYEFEGAVLKAAINETFINRKANCDSKSLTRIKSMHENEDMSRRWRVFVRKSLNADIEFDAVISVVVEFVSKPIESIEAEVIFDKSWNPDTGWK